MLVRSSGRDPLASADVRFEGNRKPHALHAMTSVSSQGTSPLSQEGARLEVIAFSVGVGGGLNVRA